jgi:hypothetical protein
MNVDEIKRRVASFESEAHRILGVSETAVRSRVVLLGPTYDSIGTLSLKQDDMLRQALRCIEVEVYRAAHVLAWAALADYLQEFTAKDGFAALRAARAKWNFKALEELREQYTEHALIEAMFTAKQITKGEMKAFLGLLHKRNECAHPSNYFPDLNDSLGYVSEIIKRIRDHKNRKGAAP